VRRPAGVSAHGPSKRSGASGRAQCAAERGGDLGRNGDGGDGIRHEEAPASLRAAPPAAHDLPLLHDVPARLSIPLPCESRARRSPFVNNAKDASLSITEFDGWLPGPGLFDTELLKVERGQTFRYTFELGDDGVSRWRDMNNPRNAFTSEQLAEYHLRRLVAHGGYG